MVDLNDSEGRESALSLLWQLREIDAPCRGTTWRADGIVSLSCVQMAVAGIKSKPIDQVVAGFKPPRRHHCASMRRPDRVALWQQVSSKHQLQTKEGEGHVVCLTVSARRKSQDL